MIRAIILAATAATLITMYLDRPKPVQAVEVKYCPIIEKTAAKDRLGRWQVFWAEKFGPCDLMDRYEWA